MGLLGIGSLVSGIGSLVGAGAAYKGQKDANRTNLQIADKTNQTNIDLANQARDHDVAMWNRQNEYNTPEQQMQRLKEAGLNPNLIYDSGAGSVGNAGQPQKAPIPEQHRATVNNEMASLATLNLMPAIAQFQDWQVKKAQIDNIKAQTQATIEQNIGNSLRNYALRQEQPFMKLNALNKYRQLMFNTDILGNQHQQSLYDLNQRSALYHDELASKKRGLSMNKYQLEGQKLTNRQKLLEIQLDENLKPYGMHKGDELWQRILLPVLLKGLKPHLNKFSNHILNTF